MAGSKPLFLSASRADTFHSCSQLYAAKYLWKLPDPGNDGSRRGSATHEVLELLLKHRHHKRFKEALAAGTCMKVAPLWRLIRRFADRFQVGDEANLKMIDGFIMTGLRFDFLGPIGTIETVGEKEFTITVDRPEDGIRYAVRGYIDKTHHVQDADGLRLETLDYKSGKARFPKEKQDYNLQSFIYQLALRHLYPHIKRRLFRFSFVKFKKDPFQSSPTLSDEELDGFEVILTHLQRAMEAFNLSNASDNLAFWDQERKWLCGKEGLKVDGTKAFICMARNPLDYWVLLDKEGEVAASALTEEELQPKDGQVVVSRHYPGCSAFWDPRTGQRRAGGTPSS